MLQKMINFRGNNRIININSMSTIYSDYEFYWVIVKILLLLDCNSFYIIYDCNYHIIV